eukprot:SAG11_NODE_136_length_15118_cov_14.188495_19_plen_264_part_00
MAACRHASAAINSERGRSDVSIQSCAYIQKSINFGSTKAPRPGLFRHTREPPPGSCRLLFTFNVVQYLHVHVGVVPYTRCSTLHPAVYRFAIGGRLSPRTSRQRTGTAVLLVALRFVGSCSVLVPGRQCVSNARPRSQLTHGQLDVPFIDKNNHIEKLPTSSTRRYPLSRNVLARRLPILHRPVPINISNLMDAQRFVNHRIVIGAVSAHNLCQSGKADFGNLALHTGARSENEHRRSLCTMRRNPQSVPRPPQLPCSRCLSP